jgi:hypothetical protein
MATRKRKTARKTTRKTHHKTPARSKRTGRFLKK